MLSNTLKTLFSVNLYV